MVAVYVLQNLVIILNVYYCFFTLQVYIAGFGLEQRDKLCKILNFSGATRYDDISSRLTHVIVGDPTCNDLKIIQSKDNCHASIVTIQWLIDSMEQQHPVPELNYIVNQAAQTSYCNSPLSKKVGSIRCCIQELFQILHTYIYFDCRSQVFFNK